MRVTVIHGVCNHCTVMVTVHLGWIKRYAHTTGFRMHNPRTLQQVIPETKFGSWQIAGKIKKHLTYPNQSKVNRLVNRKTLAH